VKEQDKLTDEACREAPAAEGGVGLCAAHARPLVQCANDRLKQVKQAREMEARTMASARAWQKEANDARARQEAKRDA